ncbi:hypothetical protein HZB93_00520 [Candidatus Falkowbacteria bacterium]|nr:hypothetical protein [Candidatus Falkowbacteria bacterium]
MKIKKNKKEKLTEPQEVVCVESSDKKEVVCSPRGEVVKVEAKEAALPQTKRGGILIGTINFFAAPYQSLKESHERRYGERRKHFIIDLILLGMLGILFGFNLYLFASRIMTGNYLSWFNFPELPGEGVVSGPVAESFLKTQMKINGQESIVVNPGEDLEYAIIYSNGRDKDLYDVAVKVNLEGALLDFNKLSLGQGVLRSGAVVWTKDQVSDFKKLSPGATGELKFKISTDMAAEPSLALKFGSLLSSSIEISYKLESDFGQAYKFKSAAREDKFNSDLFLESLARYYTEEGDQLGLGPLPPKVGETTRYWIFLSVDNNLNDLADVSVSAVLPPNVFWTEKMSVTLGELSYNSTRRTITWKVGDVGHYTGEDWPKRGVAFELALTPTAEQLGKEPTLLGKIKVYGEDKFTGEFLEKDAPDLTTNLIYDSLAGGKSKVVK